MMAATFGSWENDDNVPYTVYYEKARKNKGGKVINPDLRRRGDEPNGRGNAASAPGPNLRPQSDEPNRWGEAAWPASAPGPSDEPNRRGEAASAPAANPRPWSHERYWRGAAGTRPNKDAAVPRFGEWDENDNFTPIFNKVREERNTGAGNISGTPRHPSYGTPGRQKDQPKKCCCKWW